jgi:hypothetical protein
LENVHVRDSYAGGAGGGVNNADPAFYEWVVEPLVPPKSGRVELINSTFSGNAAGSSGAAINNSSNGTISILASSQIINNPGLMIPDPAQVIDPLDPEPIEYVPAPGVYEPGAGAIANEGATDTVGTVRIADSTISGNFAASNGAGILNAGSGSYVSARPSVTPPRRAVAVYTTGGTVTVSDSTLGTCGWRRHHSNGRWRTACARATLPSRFRKGPRPAAAWPTGEAVLTITDVTFAITPADAGGGLHCRPGSAT